MTHPFPPRRSSDLAVDPAGAQIDLAAQEVLACRKAGIFDRIDLLEVRRAEALRIGAAEAQPVEDVPRRGDLWPRDAAEIAVMFIASGELERSGRAHV